MIIALTMFFHLLPLHAVGQGRPIGSL